MDDAQTIVLVHYGVKGMRWGVRKTANLSENDIRRAAAVKGLAKIERQRTSLSRRLLPDDLAVVGAGAKAQAAKKVLKLKEVKSLDGSPRLVPSEKTPKLTPENKAYYNRKITRRAYAKYTAAGVVSVGVILASGSIAGAKLSDPKLAATAVRGSLYLAAAQTLLTTRVIAGIHRDSVDKLLADREQELRRTIRVIDRSG